MFAAGACQTAVAAAAPAARLTITVHPGAAGAVMPANLIGLSVEASELTRPQFGAADLVSYMKTLDPAGGVLRVGGNSSDNTFWTSTGERPPSWSQGTITPASLHQLASVAKASGWKVILGVNLKHADPTRAADEASHAVSILGSSLLAIEIGNEPNYYYTSTSAYFTEFESYVAAIRKAVPGVPLSGPDPGHEHPAFLAAFASNEARHPDVSIITNHHYPLSACGGAKTTIAELLGTASVQNETGAAQATVAAGQQLHVPPAITETNSVTCGGTAGVSNTYASSLWALDYGLLLASSGITEADFHGSVSGCGTYSPLCGGGGLVAQPVFYGMLAVTLVGPGHFLQVTNPGAATIRAYAVSDGSHLTVVLDNVADPAKNGPTTVQLSLGSSYSSGRQALLATSSAAGLSATTGITLGGHAVAANGSFPVPSTTPVSISGQSATVTLAAGTASIIQFTG
ncbi:MAG: hypothetical protein JO345_17080 [Streptosporangiaceae bacterium]|nr:hypothetical protein [Streptosporangiaceae bacterium]